MIILPLSTLTKAPLCTMSSSCQSCGSQDGALVVDRLKNGLNAALAWPLGSVETVCWVCMQMALGVSNTQQVDAKPRVRFKSRFSFRFRSAAKFRCRVGLPCCVGSAMTDRSNSYLSRNHVQRFHRGRSWVGKGSCGRQHGPKGNRGCPSGKPGVGRPCPNRCTGKGRGNGQMGNGHAALEAKEDGFATAPVEAG